MHLSSLLTAATGAILLLGTSLTGEELSSEPLPPAVAARSFTVASDLEIELILAEPLIAQPVFLNFDERGRMWVVEYRQYPHPAGLKVVSHDHFWRAVYDKVPLAPPNHVPGKDRISIHEDADGDGTFESHKVFLDGLNMVTAVERGRGGVWVLNPPYLLFYADQNWDDVSDADPMVHLAGFGLEDTHAVANSLRWGPDGWLYGAHGSTVTAHVTRPGVKAPPVYIQGQCIWRYHPETRRFEVFAEGGGNAFGVEIDAKGRVFSGHNGGDTRGFHYMQGAYLRKGFEKHGPLSNPYAFGYFEPMPHHKVERFTHNFIIYDGAALPARYAGKLLGIEPLQGRVVLSEIVPDGSSFRTKDLERPITSRDRWFRPVDIKAGPDGCIYLCDWYDRQINHAGNMEAAFEAGTGRVYRLRPADKKPVAPVPLGDLSSKQLIERLGAENKWVRQTALRLLADRRDASLTPQLAEKLERSAGQLALETFWALHLGGGLTEDVARKALDHEDPFVRLWCVRLLGDQGNLAPALAAKIVERAHSESDLEARSQLASTARRLPVKECLAVVRELAARDPDAADKRMPLLIWWALEAQVAAHPEEVLAMFESSSMWRLPLVEDHLLERLMRRFAQAGTRRDLLACARLFDLSPAAEYSRKLMAGFEAAFSGRPLAGLPDQLVQAMARHNVRSVAIGLRQREPDAVEEALRTIANEQAPADKRLEYLSILREVPVPASVPVLLRIVESGRERAVRKAALSALQVHDEPHVASAVIAQFSRFDAELQNTALNLLASRTGSALQLAEAVRSGWIRADAVAPNILRKMQLHHDEKLLQLIAQLWPAPDTVSAAALEQRMQKIATVLRAGSGDPYQGQVLFDQQCGACHLLFGRGGQIGPDLTAFERTDLNGMLLSIVNPNAEIREGYEHLVVTTKDGRMLSGFMVDKDNQTMVLRGLDGQNTTLAHNDVAALKPAGLSLMPEGLLDPLDDRQVRDLFAYLRSTQPLVPKPNTPINGRGPRMMPP